MVKRGNVQCIYFYELPLYLLFTVCAGDSIMYMSRMYVMYLHVMFELRAGTVPYLEMSAKNAAINSRSVCMANCSFQYFLFFKTRKVMYQTENSSIQ